MLCKMGTEKRSKGLQETVVDSGASIHLMITANEKVQTSEEVQVYEVMKITTRRKGSIRWVIVIWCTSFGPVPQAMKIPDAKATVDKEWDKLETLQVWASTKARNKKEVVQDAQKEQRTVHFATLMDICHLKISELEPIFSKIQRPGSCSEVTLWKTIQTRAVFRKQVSSASQMTPQK